MKKNLLAVAVLALFAILVFSTGCTFSGSTFHAPSRGWGLAPVGESTLPPTEVRRSSTVVELGSYSYYHDQGESRDVNVGMGYYGERVVDYSRRTWNNKSEYKSTRRVPFYSPTVDVPFTYPGTSGGVGGSGRVLR